MNAPDLRSSGLSRPAWPALLATLILASAALISPALAMSPQEAGAFHRDTWEESAPSEPLLRVGFGKIEITPGEPELFHGSNDNYVSDSYEPLHVKVMTLDDGTSRAVVVAADIINWTQDIVDGFRAQMKQQLGLRPDQVILNASHTHEGPNVRHAKARPYVQRITAETVDLVEKTFAGAEEAHLHFGRGEFSLNINRRGLDRNGFFVRQINPYGLTDPEVIVLKAVTPDGRVLGATVNFACHPTSVQMFEFGGDFPAVGTRLVEESLPGDPVVLFLQGAAGDQKLPNESTTKGGPLRYGYEGGLERLYAYSRGFAQSILAAIDGPTKEVRGTLRTALGTAELPLVAHTVDEFGEDPLAGPQRRLARMAKLMQDGMDENGRYRRTHPCEVYVLEIGDRFVQVGLNGEICVGVGLRIKTQLQNRLALVTAYTGPSIGYFPSYAQLVEKGYEAKIPYSLEAEDFLVGKVMELVSPGAETFWLRMRDEYGRFPDLMAEEPTQP